MLQPGQVKMEPLDIKQELNPDSTTGNSPKKKPGRPKKMKQEKITEHLEVVKKKRKHDRFKGMSEEEVASRLLPDHLAHNLDIVIVGINPGLYAAFVGHHYAGPGNHFWKCLFLSGLVPEQMNAMQDKKLLDYGIGFTNIVARTTRGSADLKKKEIQEGALILAEKLRLYKPKIAVFNGKGIYEIFLGHKKFYFGKQPEYLPGTETYVYVMPSSSARCSQLPRAVDKVPFYAALRKFKDHLNGKIPDLDDKEITFVDFELKTVKKEIKEEVKTENPEDSDQMSQQSLPNGDSQLNQFIPGSYNVFPHTPANSAHGFQGMFENSSPPNLPQIKQEPGTEQPVMATTCMNGMRSSPLQNGGVKIKQEPGLSNTETSCASYGQSYPFSNGQYDLYSQSQTSTQNDSHLNNFLHGLYGMVNQVASEDPNTSKYGVVNQASQLSTNPIQFNDALCDIVKDGNSFEFEEDMGKQRQKEPVLEKPAKKSKPRKRKSKCETVSSPEMMSDISNNQGQGELKPQQMQVPPAVPLNETSSPYEHSIQQSIVNHSQGQSFPHHQPPVTYSNMPPFPHPPMSTLPHPSMTALPHPPMTTLPHPPSTTAYNPSFTSMGPAYYPGQSQSFSQMMSDGLYFQGMSHNPTGHQPANMNDQSHMSHMYPSHFQTNLPIKQEKPDE